MQDPVTTHPAKDNLLGICHAIGEDFGFNPFWLRLVLAVGIIAKPEIVLGVYGVLGLSVLASRLLTRGARPARETASVVALPPREEAEPMRLAA